MTPPERGNMANTRFEGGANASHEAQ